MPTYGDPALIKAFKDVMAQKGMPVTPLPKPAGAKGPAPQAYQLPDYKTVHVKTNEKPALVTANKRKEGAQPPVDAPLRFERYDFVAAVFRHPDKNNWASVYMIPTRVAAKEAKANQAAHLETMPEDQRENRLYVIRFDDGPGRNFGYARKWKKYHVGEIELSSMPASEPPIEQTGETPDQLIERHRQEIASALRVVPEAVTINVALVFADKDGKTRSAFIR
jgi:hypothetical protein